MSVAAHLMAIARRDRFPAGAKHPPESNAQGERHIVSEAKPTRWELRLLRVKVRLQSGWPMGPGLPDDCRRPTL